MKRTGRVTAALLLVLLLLTALSTGASAKKDITTEEEVAAWPRILTQAEVEQALEGELFLCATEEGAWKTAESIDVEVLRLPEQADLLLLTTGADGSKSLMDDVYRVALSADVARGLETGLALEERDGVLTLLPGDTVALGTPLLTGDNLTTAQSMAGGSSATLLAWQNGSGWSLAMLPQGGTRCTFTGGVEATLVDETMVVNGVVVLQNGTQVAMETMEVSGDAVLTALTEGARIEVSEDGSVDRIGGDESRSGSVHWGVVIPCVIFGAIVFLGLAWFVGRRWSR
ncbi:MAG: hypothetical protein IKD96_06080 [Oscillospiraceae bacterium]|nr:hypothetical protein [Oscillospiraceae bacterium]